MSNTNQLMCGACGAPLEYDGVSLYVSCPYCGTPNEVTPEYVLEEHLQLLKDKSARDEYLKKRFRVERTVRPSSWFETPPFDVAGLVEGDPFLARVRKNLKSHPSLGRMGEYVPLFVVVLLFVIGPLIQFWSTPYTIGVGLFIVMSLVGLLVIMGRAGLLRKIRMGRAPATGWEGYSRKYRAVMKALNLTMMEMRTGKGSPYERFGEFLLKSAANEIGEGALYGTAENEYTKTRQAIVTWSMSGAPMTLSMQFDNVSFSFPTISVPMKMSIKGKWTLTLGKSDHPIGMKAFLFFGGEPVKLSEHLWGAFVEEGRKGPSVADLLNKGSEWTEVEEASARAIFQASDLQLASWIEEKMLELGIYKIAFDGKRLRVGLVPDVEDLGQWPSRVRQSAAFATTLAKSVGYTNGSAVRIKDVFLEDRLAGLYVGGVMMQILKESGVSNVKARQDYGRLLLEGRRGARTLQMAVIMSKGRPKSLRLRDPSYDKRTRYVPTRVPVGKDMERFRIPLEGEEKKAFYMMLNSLGVTTVEFFPGVYATLSFGKEGMTVNPATVKWWGPILASTLKGMEGLLEAPPEDRHTRKKRRA